MKLARFFATNSKVEAVEQDEWPALVEEASVELLLPALRARVAALGVASNLPPDIELLLATAESLNRERNQTLVSEAVEAAKLLNSIGVQPVALKGLAYLISGISRFCLALSSGHRLSDP